MQNAYCSLRGPRGDPVLSYSLVLPSPLVLVFHFLQVAPNPFQICPGLVVILSVTRGRNLTQTGLGPKLYIDSCDGKAPEEVGSGSGQVIPMALPLVSVVLGLFSVSPKGA